MEELNIQTGIYHPVRMEKTAYKRDFDARLQESPMADKKSGDYDFVHKEYYNLE